MNPSSFTTALEAVFRERPYAHDGVDARDAFDALADDAEDDARDTLPVSPPSVVPSTLRTGVGPALPSGFDELDAFDVFQELDVFDDAEALHSAELARFAEMRDQLGASQVLSRAAALEPALAAAPELGAPTRDEAITPPPPARRAGLRFGAR
jgi:hypothetical protein